MYCQHSILRMQQRGITQYDVEVLLQFGHSEFHRGREIVSFDHKTWLVLCESQEISSTRCDRLRKQYLVLDGGDIVTVAHKKKRFKRDRH